ncbi:UNVERIFIED_CONTAM: hypothetical protein K2H54_059411 [Gekko kuhli]
MIECYRGNILQGENVIKCEANNTWHPTPPVCVPRDCDPPKLIPFAVLKSDEQRESYPVGTTLTYHCIPGYEYIPRQNPNIQCLTTSEWSESPQFCRMVKCSRPEVSNGHIRLSHQSSYSYDCDPPPGLYFAELLDAYKDKTSYPVGSIVKYKCQLGYTKQPEMPFFIKCLATMKWSSVHVLCKKLSCGDPGQPKNGRLIASKDFLFGSSVNFTCDEGHRLIGQSSIQCVVSGERVVWSGEIPICQCVLPTLPSGVEEKNTTSADGTLLPSSGPNVISSFGSQAPPVTVPTYTSTLPTLRTELDWEKLFIILQEIKDIVNRKTKSLEERLDGLEKKVDKVIYELKSCCQQAKETLEEEDEA